jgi:hypothetical protein
MLKYYNKARRRAGGYNMFIYFKNPEVVNKKSNAEKSRSEE